jgi:hypothetical protein
VSGYPPEYLDYMATAHALRRLAATRERLREALERIAGRQLRTLATLRKHRIVFDGSGGEWEKVALTIYTDLCEVDSIARAALTADDEDAA